MSDDRQEPPCSGRRRLLRNLAATGLLGGGVGLAGCNRGPEAPGASIPLEDVSPGRRVRVQLDGDPVELLRRDGTVRARSLLCTHFGCEVRWSPEEERYLCPCHDGRFDPEGRPVAGPPNRPLRTLEARVVDGRIVVTDPGETPS